jgi:Flp pilus assembly protein TadG
MRERELAIVWIVLAVVFIGGLIGLLQYSRSLRSSGAQAGAEVASLRAAIEQKQREILAEMKSNATTLQEMSWTGTTGDPVAFLSRVAELTQGSRLKVMAVGPLERQTAPQFSKSWHALTVQGPFQDLVELAIRVENERGTLDNVAIEAQAAQAPARPQPGQAPQPRVSPEILAKFRVTALQLTQQARMIIEDAAKPSGVSLTPPKPSAGLSLPVPSPGSQFRDPFAFGAPVDRPRLAEGTRLAEGGVPRAVFNLQGIVAFPGGHLAILNNQIVRTGEKTAGYTVERITDTTVLLRQPDGTPRQLSLPDIGAVAGKKQPAPGKPSEPGPSGPAPAPSPPAPDGPSGPRR